MSESTRGDADGHARSLTLDWRGAWVAATLGWLWIYPSVLIGLHWQDTSEFIATGRALSVAHPPGHPLTLVSVHLSQLAPWLDAAARAHLASSFWGMFGVGASYLGFQALLSGGHDQSNSQRRATLSWGDRFTWLLGSLLMVGAPLVWLQVTRAEVYASQWALTSAVWASALYAERGQDQRGWVVAGLWLGGLAANHTLLSVALSVALLPRLLTLNIKLRAWLLSLSASSLGLSLYLYIWWRGRWGGVSGWGWVEDMESLWVHVSAQVWQKQVSARAVEVDFAQNLIEMLAFALDQVGIWVGGLGLITLTLGAVRWVREYSERLMKSRDARYQVSWGPTFALATLCVALTKLTYPMSVQNPDFSGYIAAGAPSALLLLTCSVRRISSRWLWLVFAIGLLGMSTQQSRSRPPASRGAEAWGRQVTAEVETGGTLWSSFYSTHFITSALWVTEGWRPDLRLAFRGHREMRWAESRLSFIPPLQPSLPLNDPRSLSLPRARHEVEREIDTTPWLWSRLSIPGSADGHITSALRDDPLSSDMRSLNHAMKAMTQRLLALGDAHTIPSPNSQDFTPRVCDEDTAYAWALHHEVNLRWIGHRLTAPQDAEHRERLHRAQEVHKEFLDWWVSHIATSRWRELHFSRSAP